MQTIMFKPHRILQAAAISFLLSGCATSQVPIHEGRAAAQATARSQSASRRAEPSRSNDAAEAAGRPQGDFIDANGRLLPQVQSFAQQISLTHHLDPVRVETLLKSARYNAQAVRLMTPPAHTRRLRRAWTSYRQRHVDPIRIRLGVAFWKTHRAALDQASARYGVPPSIIVSIIGIETVYGRYTGTHRVLDTLTTLGFRYPDKKRPDREAMFRKQLADLIVLDERGELDAETVLGSYAGAMGLPQFMPGSLMRYAVDGDGDGRINLADNTDDAIASIAAFLQAHGWVADVPVFAPVTLPRGARSIAQEDLVPQSSWPALEAAGAQAQAGGGTLWKNLPLGVIDLQDEIRGTHDYRCATPNFFAITHYNRSYFYATAVTDLAHEIARQIGYGDPNQISAKS